MSADDADDAQRFRELAYRLASRAIQTSETPWDVPQSVLDIAKRGVAEAARQHNALVITSAVPAELMSLVFAFLPPADRVFASHVSQHWRAISLATPSLWSDIETCWHTDHVQTFLRRSASAPLHITAHGDNCYDNFVGPVLTHMGRFRTLSLASNHLLMATVCAQGNVWSMLRDLRINPSGIHSPSPGSLQRLLSLCPLLISLSLDFLYVALQKPVTFYVPLLRSLRVMVSARSLPLLIPDLCVVRHLEVRARYEGGDGDPDLLKFLVGTDQPLNNVWLLEDQFCARANEMDFVRILHDCSGDEQAWYLTSLEHMFHATSLVMDENTLPNIQLAPAPNLRTLTLLDPDWSDWEKYYDDTADMPWSCPVLQVVRIGYMSDEENSSSPPVVLRTALYRFLHGLLGFSKSRHLSRLEVWNATVPEDDKVRLEIFVDEIHFATDASWDPRPKDTML
ncbi:hypothetical protein EXIGLDRAFT_728307 [Exidia glandulosa HHB12029]|uniref:F-box domain-containing protein n=1 Tax=Exidia glandulosa HHB12029 TaxID=1314781 RepID=A0A165LSV3_EXIGL|nr:hypothetical protein EXIGLDRAFT_728307 [Exidia glandulosa HHB12029]